jgi:glycosyltransferase involved in cell wall biosynthesis
MFEDMASASAIVGDGTQRAPKISILCHDLSDNALGRSFILGKALQRQCDVEIVGFSKGGIWAPVATDPSVPFRLLTMRTLRAQLRELEADLYYAVKPKLASYGLGMALARHHRKPLLLDIDDWEMGFYRSAGLRQQLESVAKFWDPANITCTWAMDRLIDRTKVITVSNHFLQKRFGGTLIPHFRDTTEFDPAQFDPAAFRIEHHLNDQRIILFLGTPRPHKGIPELIQAVERLNRSDVTLLIVGATARDSRHWPTRRFLKVLGPQPLAEIPRILAAADIVTVLQSESLATQGQLPAKVFDAMSMARPIVASRVSDLPEILHECGEIVEPGNIDQIAATFAALLDDPARSCLLGRRARERCIAAYSYDAVAPRLYAVVARALSSDRRVAYA